MINITCLEDDTFSGTCCIVFSSKELPQFSDIKTCSNGMSYERFGISSLSIDALKKLPFKLEQYVYQVRDGHDFHFGWEENVVLDIIQYLKENLSGEENVILMEFRLFDNRKHEEIYLGSIKLGSTISLNLGEYRADEDAANEIYEQYFKEYFFTIPMQEKYMLDIDETTTAYCNLEPVQLIITNDELLGAEEYVKRYYRG